MARLSLPALVGLLAAQAVAAQQPRAAMSDSARPLPGVVVTATRDSISPLTSPLPTGALDSAALRREHGVSLAHTLRQLPGVRALSTGEQIGKPVIRGLAGSRVLVLDNGLRLEDYSWSDEDGPSVDARLADRVEVIRGPASVLYGSDALGGVVNVIPARVPNAYGGEGFRRGQLELYGASNNREGGGVLGMEGASGRWGGHATFVGRFGQDLHTPAGEIRNTGFFAGNGDAALGLHHASGAESTVRFAHYGGEYKLLEIDAPVNAPVDEEGGPARITLDERLQLTHQRRMGLLNVGARAQLQRHALQEKSDLPNPAPGQAKEATVFDLVLNTATMDLLAHHGSASHSATGAAGTRWSGTVGLSGLLQGNDTRGIIPLVPDATIGSAGVFAFERLTLGRISFLAGARGDARHLTASANSLLALSAQTRNYSAFTGDVGAVYRIVSSLSFAVNAGAAWRAPNLFELFANGPRLGEGRYEFGKATLVPERSVNLDASVRWDSSRLHAEAATFRTRINDYIYIAPTSRTQDNLRVYEYAQANAELVGGELSAAFAATHMMTVRGKLDAVRGTNTTLNDPLPLTPPVRAGVGVEFHDDARVTRPYLTVNVEHVARQTRLSQSERDAIVLPGRYPLQTGAYALLDVGAGVQTRLGGRTTRLDLQARNLTNIQYRDYLSRYKEFAYAPGTNIVLRASTAF